MYHLCEPRTYRLLEASRCRPRNQVSRPKVVRQAVYSTYIPSEHVFLAILIIYVKVAVPLTYSPTTLFSLSSLSFYICLTGIPAVRVTIKRMEFGAGVAALLETYDNCLKLLRAFKRQNKEDGSYKVTKASKQQALLKHSLKSDRKKVERAYASRLSVAGRSFERGDRKQFIFTGACPFYPPPPPPPPIPKRIRQQHPTAVCDAC